MEHFFVDRKRETQAFREALEALYADSGRPQVLLFHGESGMGKTWLTQQCLQIAQADLRKPFLLFVDCNRSNMTLDGLFYYIHLQLESHFKKEFEEYLEFLNQIEEIEQEVEEEIRANPENAQKIASVVSAVASKAIADTVPGANTFIGEQNIQKVTDLVTGGIATGITALRQQFARKKLDRNKYRLLQKDLQAEQARRFAQLLNDIGHEHKRKFVLFIDRFEKLALSSNLKSDVTYHEYWHKHFLNRLSADVLVVQNGRLDFNSAYQLQLPQHRVAAFQLQAFKQEDIAKILEQLLVLRAQMAEYEDFAKQVFEATLGFPVAVGTLRGNLQSLRSAEDFEKMLPEFASKETMIIKYSIDWFLDNNADAGHRETIYKLAICCTSAGKIEEDAIKYILQKTQMTFPQVEAELAKLSQLYSFIDCMRWTMHELAREFILNLVLENFYKRRAFWKNFMKRLPTFATRVFLKFQRKPGPGWNFGSSSVLRIRRNIQIKLHGYKF